MATIKRTMLELLSDILDELEADPVNDLDDTEEATIITNIIINSFWDIIATRDIPEHEDIIRLTSAADNTSPTALIIPDATKQIKELRYNKSDDAVLEYRKLKWLEGSEFLDMVNRRDSSDSSVDTAVTLTNSVQLLVYNDKPPAYWTTFDNYYVYCDAYDSDVESTLQGTKCQAIAVTYPSITRSASHVLDLEESHMQYLYNEVLSRASLRINETPDQKAEQWANRHRASLQWTKHREGSKVWRRNFGRSR